jgi:predicted N-acetyltransferase YhbS
MIEYRKTKTSDWNQIIELVNHVFQPLSPMQEGFPLLLNQLNFGFVAVDRAKNINSIIGFIGVFPETLKVQKKIYFGFRMGAVCIDQNYQGKKIGTKLFEFTNNFLRNCKADYILISGQGDLYMKNGAEYYGDFYHYTFVKKEESLVTDILCKELEENLETCKIIQQLQLKKEMHLVKSVFDLMVFVNAKALARLSGGKQIILFTEHKNKKALIIGIIGYESKDSCTIIETMGDSELYPILINYVLQTSKVVHIRLQKKLEMCSTPFILEKNAGSIIYINSEVRGIDFPHSWDMCFV